MKKKKIFNKIILIFVLILVLGVIYLVYNKTIMEKNNTDLSPVSENNTINKDSNISAEEEIKKQEDNTDDGETSIPKTEINENEAQTESKNLNVSYIELVGDEEITLNVGDKYTELGAKAYNADGKDISNEIKIDSSVDTSKQGRYTVSYSIGNWIVMRYVIVK